MENKSDKTATERKVSDKKKEKINRGVGQAYCLYETHSRVNNVWQKRSDSLVMCINSKCPYKHKLTNRPTEICKKNTLCPLAGLSCFLLHDTAGLKALCMRGVKCRDSECDRRHPIERTTNVCHKGIECDGALFGCDNLHPLTKMTKPCKFKDKCNSVECKLRHPPTRNLCKYGYDCWEYITKKGEGCDAIHPPLSRKPCAFSLKGEECKTWGCPYAHPPDAKGDCQNEDCPSLKEDSTEVCNLKHKARKEIADIVILDSDNQPLTSLSGDDLTPPSSPRS